MTHGGVPLFGDVEHAVSGAVDFATRSDEIAQSTQVNAGLGDRVEEKFPNQYPTERYPTVEGQQLGTVTSINLGEEGGTRRNETVSSLTEPVAGAAAEAADGASTVLGNLDTILKVGLGLGVIYVLGQLVDVGVGVGTGS